MTAIRPIDRWFIDQVLPSEARFLRVASRLVGDGEDAADLVHEAYAKLLNGSAWSQIVDVDGYVIRVIRNAAVSRMRRARVVRFSQLAAADEELLVCEQPDPFRVASSRQRATKVETALAAMPERCRTAIQRCRFEEGSPRAVAMALGLSLSTLEKRLARGLHLLATALYPEEVDTPAPQGGVGTGQPVTGSDKASPDAQRSACG